MFAANLIWHCLSFETLHYTRCLKFGLFCTAYFSCLYRNVFNTKLCLLWCSVKAFLGGSLLKEQIFIISDSLRICFLLFLCILQNGINCAYFIIFSFTVSSTILCWIYGYEFLFLSDLSLTVCCLCHSKHFCKRYGNTTSVHLQNLISFALQEGNWKMRHGPFKSGISH